MTDSADFAGDLIDRELAALVRRHRTAPTAPTGACRNCGEPLAADRAFCDADCRDDFQRAEKNTGHVAR